MNAAREEGGRVLRSDLGQEGPSHDNLATTVTAVVGGALSPDDRTLTAAPRSSRAGAGPTIPTEPGSSFHHYEIIRCLGRGGMGEVHLARDTRLGRLVAIKLLTRCGGSDAQRLLAEARLTAQVGHENIVVVYELGEHLGTPYLVLEHLEGQTLQQWLDERGERDDLPCARAAEIMIPVARALACAHERGVVHRDLKPSNILLTRSGVTKVLDFGIAKRLGAPALTGSEASLDGGEVQLTQDGVLIGTIPYMSPEQLGMGEIDHRTDLWAAGIILAELVLGRHPLAPLTLSALHAVRRLDVPMPSARALRPDLGRLGALIDRCLAKRREDRLGSARELLAELEAIAAATWRAGADEEQCPYLGLAAFGEGDAARFFGRGRAVTEVVRRLGERPLCVIVGPSGAGKSSFVRAGVIPALERAGEAWEAFAVRPGARPLSALAELLLSRASDTTDPGAPDASVDRDALAARLRAEPGLLGVQLRARARRKLGRALLFVDQLEELYTLAPEEDRGPFFACLAGVADDTGSPLRVVAAIRSDFLDRLAEADAASAGFGRAIQLLPPMDREGLREALARPLEAAGYRFESDALVGEMVSSLEHTAGALPLLQFTAARLWELRDREARALTEASYRQIGGVEGTLAGHADRVLEAMSPVERAVTRDVLLRLLTPERTRAPATLGELRGLSAAPAEVERVVERLVDARLLTIEGQGDAGAIVEIVHESLITRWPTLAQWTRDSHEDAALLASVRGAARQWEASGEAEGLLWRGQAAADLGRWYARRPAAMGRAEARYVEAVLTLARRARRRRRGALAGSFAALALLAVVMTSLALRERAAGRAAERSAAQAGAEAARAQAEAERAQSEAVRARDAMRLAVARGHQGDPTTSLALLREIEGRDPPPGWSALAKRALHEGVARVVLAGHTDVVTSVAWSPDGARLASTSWDRTVRVWRADGAGAPLVLAGHAEQVTSAAWSPDGRRIASGSYDRTVRVWRADGAGDPAILAGHTDRVTAVAWSPDGSRIASSSYDGTVRVWRADGAGAPVILSGHTGEVLSAAWSPDGVHLVTGGADTTVRTWRADGAGAPRVLRGHADAVRSVAWSPDGRRIASGSYDKTARVWRADGAGAPIVLGGHDSIWRVAWSPDSARVAVADAQKNLRVWRPGGGALPRVLRGHAAAVECAAWSPDGASIASAADDRTVRIWSADDPRAPLLLERHVDVVTQAAWSPDGARILTISNDETLRVWPSDGASMPLVQPGAASWAAFDPRGERIAAVFHGDAVLVLGADGSGAPVILRGHGAIIRHLAWAPDGARLASAADDRTVRVWRPGAPGAPLVLTGHADRVAWAAWSPDGARIASASQDRTVRVWNADGSGAPLVLEGHADAVTQVAWSPDGARIASASRDSTVRVWSADGGAPLVLTGHADEVRYLAWSPDGARIASASRDGTARIWRADGGGAPLVLAGHADVVTSVAWSPDGVRLVSSSRDRTVRIWSADGGGAPLVLEGHGDLVTMAAWSPDGRRVVSASNDSSARVWSDLEPVTPGDPALWKATSHCLSVAERRRLLGQGEEQARADEARCRRRVGEAAAAR